jgi:hypothetical protein
MATFDINTTGVEVATAFADKLNGKNGTFLQVSQLDFQN